MATSRNYSKSVIAASDEIKDVFCEPCFVDGKQVGAEGFCVDCSEYLCGQCFNSHGRFKAFRNHVLQDKNNMPIDVTRVGVLDVCVEKCPKHPTKVTEYFCRSCDTLGCSACITTNHRQCQDVDHVPDIVKDLENTKEFVEFEKNVIGKLKGITERKAKIHSRKTDVNEMRKQAKTELKKQRDEINKFFDHLEAEMDKNITLIDRNNNDRLKAASDKCIVINDELNKMKYAMETKKRNGQKCELFVTMKQSEADMKNIDRQIEMLNEESKIQRYKLVQSVQIEKMMRNTTEICRMLTAKCVSEINVGTNNDKQTPSVTGLAVVQGHYLAVADYNNTSVKMIDTRNGSVTSEMSLDCNAIMNMTNIKDDQIVVSVTSFQPTFSSELRILRVSASGTLSTSNVITTDEIVDDLVGIAQSLYLIQDDTITVIDMQGNVRKEIKIDHSFVPRYISVSPNEKIIYFTDYDKNGVTSMTLDGKAVATYKDKDLNQPYGIAVDKDGFVYVRSSGNIQQLTKDCTQVQVLIEDVQGTNITYSDADNRLYVEGSVGTVKLYELK